MLLYIAVDCGSPPSITNGSPGTPTSTTFGGTVTYSCNDMYSQSGSATVSCLASGSWSNRPTCIGTLQKVFGYFNHVQFWSSQFYVCS